MDDDSTFDTALDEAVDLLQHGRLKEALTKVDCYLEDNPVHPGAHALRGRILTLQGDLKGAEEAVETALRLHPDYAFAHYARGLIRCAEDDGKRAIASFEQALTLNPKNLGYMTELAWAYYKTGQVPEGLALLDRIKSIDPFDPDVLLLRAQVAALEDDREEAQSCAEVALKFDPTNVFARLVLARVSMSRNAPEEAVEHARFVLDRNPNTHEALLIQIEALAQMGDVDAALAVIDKRATGLPDDPLLFAECARLMAMADRTESAMQAIRRALEIDPDFAYGHFIQGFVNRERGDVPGAIAAFETASKLDPSDVDTIKQLVLAYRQLGDLKMVRSNVDKLDKAGSKDLSVLLFLAEFAAGEGDLGDGSRWTQAALALDPDSIDANLVMANLAFMQQELAAVKNHARLVLEKDPDNQAARSLLANLPSAETSGQPLVMRIWIWGRRLGEWWSAVIVAVLWLGLFPVILVGLTRLSDDSDFHIFVWSFIGLVVLTGWLQNK